MLKLTQTVKKGGCAAKVPAIMLRQILQGVSFPPKIPGVIIDGSEFDDAAIYQIAPDLALVQTLDFFTPIVDSPYEFGAIAAANALSDVYAMGGRPKTCMAILAAPLATMGPEILQAVLQGACDVIASVEASLVGGHSIDDETLKFGLSVTGLIHPQRTWSNQGAQVGDVLVLTKPLGTGAICAGIKQQHFSEQDVSEAISSMKRLNNVIDFLRPSQLAAIHAATDITGFGLAGHGHQLARASQKSLRLFHHLVPLFGHTLIALEQGLITKAHRSNDEYTRGKISFHPDISVINKLVYFDPQTSGGLLLSVKAQESQALVEQLINFFPGTAIIGEVLAQEGFDVRVE